MIYIIGTGHSTQLWSDLVRDGTSLDARPEDVEQFEGYLSNAARELGAKVLAEEMSQKTVNGRQGGASVASLVAERLGIKHLFCDPDSDERARYELEDNFHGRERFWINRLRNLDPDTITIIFICGAHHSISFLSKVQKCGFSANIYLHDWIKEILKVEIEDGFIMPPDRHEEIDFDGPG